MRLALKIDLIVLILDLLLLAELLSAESLLFTLVDFVLEVADLVQLLATLELHRLALTLGKFKVVLRNLELSLALAEGLGFCI